MDLKDIFTKDERVPYGSDVSAGTYECADCGYEYSNQSKSSLPPCPEFDDDHDKKAWIVRSGQGDAEDDPGGG